jgi:hypothetical protein
MPFCFQTVFASVIAEFVVVVFNPHWIASPSGHVVWGVGLDRLDT